jgi:pimeloyl-ACP methyl ester carboxylesterase
MPEPAAPVHYSTHVAEPTNGQTVKVRHCDDTGLDIELYYETFGNHGDPTVLLINGLGVHCLDYDAEWCEMLAKNCLYVIRFDNRDVGLSTKIERPEPKLWKFLLPACCCCCCPEKAPYPLEAMADDAAALLDVLNIPAAHIAGVSMGGMLSQIFAIRHPSKCLSLTTIMSMTGNRDVKDPEFWVKLHLVKKPKSEEFEEMLRFRMQFENAVLATGTIVPPEDERRERASRFYKKSTYRAGNSNQAAAIVTAPVRDELLGKLTMPVLIIHGERDVLVPPDNGRHTHKCIPHSRLVLVPEMGHFLGPHEWAIITQEMVSMIHQTAAATPALLTNNGTAQP